MAYIEIDHVRTQYGKGENAFVALEDVSLNIEKGELVCLIGPSGCGKTTLLNSMAGFEKVSSGEIRIDGEVVKKPRIQYITIFQNYGLLPWKTVRQNVEFGLEKLKVPKKERVSIAEQCIAQVGLSEFSERHPHQLSGGQQQRVAIARALAINPDILFMDEPFGALDAITRMKLQEDVLRLCRENHKTVIFVTHDIEEAVFLADRIIILEPNPGKIKNIITVNLPRDRIRTSDDFIVARDKVYELLNMKHEEMPIEYYI